MHLVFIGIQGCGKGTQARKLVEIYGFKLLEMGAELRQITKFGNELGKYIKNITESGKLVDTKTIGNIMSILLQPIMKDYADMIECILKNPTNHALCYVDGKDNNVIFDGFIRNIGNKESFEKNIDQYSVVFFNLSKEKAEKRLLGRMYNPKTGETFSAGTTIDPNTHDILEKRKDDNENAIHTRIAEFIQYTLPVIEILKKEGRVIEIDADQDSEAVFNEIVEKLRLEKK